MFSRLLTASNRIFDRQTGTTHFGPHDERTPPYRPVPLNANGMFVRMPRNNNDYEVKSLSPLALQHGDSSVLERHHIFVTYQVRIVGRI